MGALGQRAAEFGNNVRGLAAVRVKREELLAKVKANREKHIRDFFAATEGYKEERTRVLREALAKAETEDASKDLYVHLEAPHNHTEDYDRVIDLLTMSLDSEVDLPSDEFDRYARDKWGWSTAFSQSVAGYTRGGKR